MPPLFLPIMVLAEHETSVDSWRRQPRMKFWQPINRKLESKQQHQHPRRQHRVVPSRRQPNPCQMCHWHADGSGTATRRRSGNTSSSSRGTSANTFTSDGTGGTSDYGCSRHHCCCCLVVTPFRPCGIKLRLPFVTWIPLKRLKFQPTLNMST